MSNFSRIKNSQSPETGRLHEAAKKRTGAGIPGFDVIGKRQTGDPVARLGSGSGSVSLSESEEDDRDIDPEGTGKTRNLFYYSKTDSMKNTRWILECGLVAGFLSSSGLALHFYTQARTARPASAAIEARPFQTERPATTQLGQTAIVPASPGLQLAGAGPNTRVADQRKREWESRIARLEAEIQNKDAVILTLRQAATPPPPDPTRMPRRSSSWLEAIKQNNPQQYATLTNRREQVRQALETSVAEKADYFRNRDPATTTEAEQAQYQHMVQLLDDSWRLAEQLRSDLSPADRRAAQQTLRQNMREVEPILTTERSKEWYNLGLQLGYNEAEARAFGEHLNTIIDLTSVQSIYRNLREGRPPDPRTLTPPAPAVPAR